MENIFKGIGVPGGGKTSWEARQVNSAQDAYGKEATILVSSFTKAGAREIAGRLVDMPEQNIGTLHSFCYRLLGSDINLTEGEESSFNDRFPDLYVSIGKKRRKKKDKVRLDDTETVEAVTPAYNDDPFDMPEQLEGDRLRNKMNVFRAKMIPREQWPDDLNLFARSWEQWKKDEDLLDFTDLLEQALENCPIAPGDAEALFLDEAQDCSKLQMAIVAQWGQHMRRLVLAGDDDQAIFNFAGSDASAFMDFPCLPQNRRYLKQSYRVPRAVHAIAERWIKKLSRRDEKVFLPRDYDGEVLSGENYRYPRFNIDLAERYIEKGKTVMFVASCGYMLNVVISQLKERGLPFSNPWKKENAGWNPLLKGEGKKLMPVDRLLRFLKRDFATWPMEKSEELPRYWTRGDLNAWGSILEAKGNLIRGGKQWLETLKGNPVKSTYFEIDTHFTGEAARAIHEFNFESREHALKAITWWREHMLALESRKYDYPIKVFETCGGSALRENPKIIVGTGHSLKGSEADVVFVFPDLSRSGRGEWNDVDRDSVKRLFYVMMTRARESLIICRPANTHSAVNLAG